MIPLTIENRAGKIRLNETVTKFAVDRLIDEISKLFGAASAASGADFGVIMNCAENAVDTLEIEINSRGGSVFDGYTIYNEIKSLRERGVEVTAKITGMAASMASVIAMACDKVEMVSHARIMIHDASNEVAGNADAMRRAADLLDGISSDIAAIYAARTGKDVGEIRVMMKKETWMTADQAKENGFVDTVIKDGKAKAEFDSEPKGMSIFAKLFPGNDEVAKIEAAVLENDSLRNELETAQARITELTGLAEVNAQLQADLSDAQAKAVNLEAVSAAAVAKIAELTAAVEVTVEKVSLRAAELLAAGGHKEPLNLNDEKEPEIGVLTRDAFNALDHIKRGEFLRTGGKLK